MMRIQIWDNGWTDSDHAIYLVTYDPRLTDGENERVMQAWKKSHGDESFRIGVGDVELDVQATQTTVELLEYDCDPDHPDNEAVGILGRPLALLLNAIAEREREMRHHRNYVARVTGEYERCPDVWPEKADLRLRFDKATKDLAAHERAHQEWNALALADAHARAATEG